MILNVRRKPEEYLCVQWTLGNIEEIISVLPEDYHLTITGDIIFISYNNCYSARVYPYDFIIIGERSFNIVSEDVFMRNYDIVKEEELN